MVAVRPGIEPTSGQLSSLVARQQNVPARMVLRTAYQVVPPQVAYALTPLGVEAAARVADLTGWIEAKLPEILAARG